MYSMESTSTFNTRLVANCNRYEWSKPAPRKLSVYAAAVAAKLGDLADDERGIRT
jgi:hypothetical protein